MKSPRLRTFSVYRLVSVTIAPTSEEGRADLHLVVHGRDQLHMRRQRVTFVAIPTEGAVAIAELLTKWMPYLEHPRWKELVQQHWPTMGAPARRTRTCSRCGGIGHYYTSPSCPELRGKGNG